MKKYIGFLIGSALLLLFVNCGAGKNSNNHTQMDTSKKFTIVKSDAEWKSKLTSEEFRVLREKGTEKPFSSEYETLWDSGTYICKACDAVLFSSSSKFDAQCGWPSFYKSIDKSAIKEITDSSHGMVRTEVVCANCGGHLGHVFDDAKYFGQPENTRYCINGVSLGFKKK